MNEEEGEDRKTGYGWYSEGQGRTGERVEEEVKGRRGMYTKGGTGRIYTRQVVWEGNDGEGKGEAGGHIRNRWDVERG